MKRRGGVETQHALWGMILLKKKNLFSAALSHCTLRSIVHYHPAHGGANEGCEGMTHPYARPTVMLVTEIRNPDTQCHSTDPSYRLFYRILKCGLLLQTAPLFGALGSQPLEWQSFMAIRAGDNNRFCGRVSRKIKWDDIPLNVWHSLTLWYVAMVIIAILVTENGTSYHF